MADECAEICCLLMLFQYAWAGQIWVTTIPHQSLIASESSVLSRFFLGNGSGPFGLALPFPAFPGPGRRALGTQSLIWSLFSGAVPQLEFYRSHSVP